MNKAHVPVNLTADTSMLRPQEAQLLQLLIAAARLVDVIYWRQTNQLPGVTPAEFVPSQPKNFYPVGVSATELEAYLADYPEMRTEILSPFTVVIKTPDGFLAVPYSEFYEDELVAIADLLDQAAILAEDEKFQQFLTARSIAFRTNQYRESDIAWIHANNGPFELTIGPYESYEDTLFGVKRSFECLLGLVLPNETRVAASFQNFVSKFDAALGDRYGYVAKTTLTPMVVMDELYASGEARYEHVPMAYNLPNDLDIHAEVGSKKVFIRNVMQAKFEIMTLPIASRVLRTEDCDRFNFDAYLKFVIGHESAHGLSFHFDGERFGHTASAIEECKADVFGMWFLYYLSDRGFLEPGVAGTAVIQHLADCLRQIRFGPEKAHAIGSIIQFNWLIDFGALTLTEDGLRFNIFQFRGAISTLGDELYFLANAGNKDALDAFAAQWGKIIPEQVRMYLARFTDIPVNIEPVFAF